MKRNQVDDTLIVPPIAGEHEPVDLTQEEEIEPVQFADTDSLPEDFKENFSPDTQMLNSLIDSVHKEAQKDPEGYGISGSLEPDEEDDAPLDDSGAPKKRRKKSRWLPIALCCLLLIAGIGAAVYFFIIAPSNIHIDDITLLDAGTDHLTVQVDSAEKDGSFQVVCSDTYGNKFHQSFQANTGLTFSGLVPGTQYTVTIEPANGEKLTGNYSIMATTLAQTEILSFTATAVSVTQAELNLIILDGQLYGGGLRAPDDDLLRPQHCHCGPSVRHRIHLHAAGARKHEAHRPDSRYILDGSDRQHRPAAVGCNFELVCDPLVEH